MILMTMLMSDLLQEKGVVHGDKDDVRCLGRAKTFQVIEC